MLNHHYNKKLKEKARILRSNMTKSEACTWKYLLSKKQILGYQFRRQRPIGNFIVDFVCLPLKLVIEIDGITHDDSDQMEKDRIRDEKLYALGFTVLRFSSYAVLNNIEDVGQAIMDWIIENSNIHS